MPYRTHSGGIFRSRGLIAVIATLVVAFSAACGGTGGLIVSQEATEGAERPTIRLVSPETGSSVETERFALTVEVTGFELDGGAIGAPNVPGTGHWHIYLDGDWMGATATTTYELESVPLGPHHLKVALANNDHSLLFPAVEDTAVIDMRFEPLASATDILSSSGTQEGESGSGMAAYGEMEEMRTPHFLTSAPEHDQMLFEPPTEVMIAFDFDLDPASSIEIKVDGVPIEVGPTMISEDNRTMSVVLPEDTPNGTYEVDYAACWPLTNCHVGCFGFMVGSASDGHSDHHHEGHTGESDSGPPANDAPYD